MDPFQTPAMPQQPTGNPILDNPQLKAAFIAAHGAPNQQPGAPAPMPAPGTIGQATHPIMGEQPSGSVNLPEGKPAALPAPSGGPQIHAPRGTTQGDEAERSRLLSTGSGVSQIQGHPFLKGLATVGDAALSGLLPGLAPFIPGSTAHHNSLVNQASGQVRQDVGNDEKQAQTAEAQGRVPLEAAQTEHVQQQTAASTPVEITPEQAQQMGAPELAGEKVSPAIMAQLSKQHGINTTKENTTQDTNDTRKEINQNTVQGRENVAGTQAASREKIAAASDAVKRSLEQMRVASGVGRGAQGSTMTTRAMAEMATTVLPRMTAISGEVDRLANEIGPAVGRWNELMVNKGGADHPEFAHLDADLDLLASAIVRTHFGARGGQQYRQELRKQFGEAQSPEDLKARIAAAQDWIQGYADMEQHPAGSQPQGGSQGGQTENWVRDPKSGKLVKQ